MPMLTKVSSASNAARAARRPVSVSRKSPTTSQCRPVVSRTGSLVKRWTSSKNSCPDPTRPSITRPLEAPMSTAATTAGPALIARSSQERRSHSGVDRDVQAGCECEVATGEDEHCGRNVLGEDLALEQRALGVVGTELFHGDAVHGCTLRAPALGEDAGAAHDAVGVHSVHPDPVAAELGGEQSHL